jgi:2-oxoglutarate ferredoxin oxidoreductase subunit beta
MGSALSQGILRLHEQQRRLEDYQGGVPRWCSGCGDNAILTAVQRLCRDEGLAPERTVFVSGIGCSSRFPHYMKTYGFHGIHGRAFPLAEGIKMARPDLNVFVNTGDGDCCSIGAAHWIHAIRYNMNLTVILHDNQVYGLTKKQASPTSPLGLKSNTTPRGTVLGALNPLTVTLGVTNASFVAQGVDWIPAPRFFVRARDPALSRVAAENVRAVGAGSGQDAASDPRPRPAAERGNQPHLSHAARTRSGQHP